MPRTSPTAKENKQDIPTPSKPCPLDGDVPASGNGHAPDGKFPILPNHPLAPVAGVFNDEPLWDDFAGAMQEYRKRVYEQDEAVGNYEVISPNGFGKGDEG